ncbi:hypothetical protein RI129_006345 [Pyrocoelia pectoralis]|uniref:Uncharacterized protein n=1 Tax=Pyrocoelia pectoralis TaxID=417401 RepID=A0AAN7VB29_9COLE
MSENINGSDLSRNISTKALKYNFLSEVGITLQNVAPKVIKSRCVVPPHTPNSEYAFDTNINTLPPFPNLDKLRIPYIREKGIKYCIEHFGTFFNCTDYETNLLQFWFLDVVTDCVWFLQDEFRLPNEMQTIVLRWFLYFMDLLRNPRKNLSRRKFFEIFKEAILIAAEIAGEGCEEIPPPDKVFELLHDNDQHDSTKSDGQSTSSFEKDSLTNVSYIEITKQDGVYRYELPKEVCTCADYKYEIVSGTYTPSEESLGKLPTKDLTDEEILKGLMVQKIWEQRLLDMEDPRKGWISYDTSETSEPGEENSSTHETDDEWIDITLRNRKEEIDQFENRATLNFGILWAIIELVFKYFYESFQFSLVKLAFQATPEVITQRVNAEWNIPKSNRAPFTKPKVEKAKPEKAKPQKKDKEDTGKTPKEKPAQKTAEPKKAPAVTMSPEEKKRLEMERLELQKLEEAKRVAEENLRYMYPLVEGVTDEFFMSIFDQWVQPTAKGKSK